MKKYIVFTLFLAGCGSSVNAQPGATQLVQSNGSVQYTLTATLETDGSSHAASLSVDHDVSVIMPKTIDALSNAGYRGTATLTIGAEFCDYRGDGQGVYVRQDGTCNTFTPDSAVELKAGDTVSLSLQGCPSQPTSVEAIVAGRAL